MNDQQRAAMQMLTDALEYTTRGTVSGGNEQTKKALAAGREALAQPQVAPDGRVSKTVFTFEDMQKATEMGYESGKAEAEALAQPQGSWVDLTDDEMQDCHCLNGTAYPFALAIIAKFKEKNTPPVATQPVQIIDGVLYEAPLKQQGEWVDLEHEDMFAIYLRAKDGELDDYKMMEAVQAKFKEKNTQKVVPQVVTKGNASEVRSTDTGEPVAWMYKFKTEDPILCKVKRDWADNHSQWKETPLYTTPPFVEAMRIETLEKAANICDRFQERDVGMQPAECAAAIRGMK